MKKLSLSELLTLFISVIALTLSIWQGYETRHHNRLSVTPKLNVEITKNQRDGEFELVLRNQGVGPAIIQDIELELEGTVTKSPSLSRSYWEQFINPLKNTSPTLVETYYEHLERGYYIRPEQAIRLLSIQQLNADNWLEMEAALRNVALIVYYQSVYEEDFQMPLDLSHVL